MDGTPRGTPFVAVVPPDALDGTVTRVAANLIRQYGKDGLRRLVHGFQSGRSNRALAPSFGVAPQRIDQWRRALGTRISMYAIHDDVSRLAEEGSEQAPPPA